MLGSDLVRPLEDDWRETLDAVARRRRWPTSHDVPALAAEVARLSAAYNDASVARASMASAGAARLGYAFARDVPKGAAAVRELVATGALALGAAALRVLDVGAGLGAATWGVVRALEAAGARGVVEATWWDADAGALELAGEIARARAGATGNAGATGAVALRATTAARRLVAAGPAADARDREEAAPFDLVLVAHVLSEIDVDAPAEGRADRHASWLRALLERRVAAHGSLVVVEPALRDRTRHLHRVRDRLAAAGATIFAPCLHAAGCPALAAETDWCHEDLPVDLPRWLAPVARAAGLRRQGLTYSYLVMRKDGLRLADVAAVGRRGASLRVVSEAFRTKGKR